MSLLVNGASRSMAGTRGAAQKFTAWPPTTITESAIRSSRIRIGFTSANASGRCRSAECLGLFEDKPDPDT